METLVASQLYQAEYLRASRRWGLTTQYQRFRHAGAAPEASVAAEAAWYFRNDVGSSNLHWVRFNVERQLKPVAGRRGTIVTLQYYVYL